MKVRNYIKIKVISALLLATISMLGMRQVPRVSYAPQVPSTGQNVGNQLAAEKVSVTPEQMQRWQGEVVQEQQTAQQPVMRPAEAVRPVAMPARDQFVTAPGAEQKATTSRRPFWGRADIGFSGFEQPKSSVSEELVVTEPVEIEEIVEPALEEQKLSKKGSKNIGAGSRSGMLRPTQVVLKQPALTDKARATLSFKTSSEMKTWLEKQDLAIKNKMSQHSFVTDLMIDLDNLSKDLEFKVRRATKIDILAYCVTHPEEIEEILNFYMDVKKSNDEISEKLGKMPEHFQKFFKEQTQKYMKSPLLFSKYFNMRSMKEKISRLFPEVFSNLYVSIVLTLLLIIFYEHIRGIYHAEDMSVLDINDPEEKNLQELFDLLVDAFNLDSIQIYKQKSKSSTSFYNMVLQAIFVSPVFFKLSRPEQVFALLHELRHYMISTQQELVIPADIVEYAKSYGVSPYGEILTGFIRGFYWDTPLTVPMQEFDADLFAAQHMGKSRWLNVASSKGLNFKFDTASRGYLSKNIKMKEAKVAQVDPEKILGQLEIKWQQSLATINPNENIYLKYVPQHLVQQAKENRLARERGELQPKEKYALTKEYLSFHRV